MDNHKIRFIRRVFPDKALIDIAADDSLYQTRWRIYLRYRHSARCRLTTSPAASCEASGS